MSRPLLSSCRPPGRCTTQWGRNADTGKVPGRLRTDPRVYRSATSLEVLIGYLYVTDMGRLDEVMGFVGWDRVAAGMAARGGRGGGALLSASGAAADDDDDDGEELTADGSEELTL